ncbi:MAG TPA: hypothetical protein VGY13_06775 [Solirubrobacteraceae bacterium]|nr:hypothetical protein [Solirubrobacteraceae bacterium]
MRLLLGAAAICSSCLGGALASGTAAPASAATSATLHVGLSPERLGASTTMFFDFILAAPGSPLPPALTTLDVRLPPGMGVDTAGLATCRAAQLARGPQGCSRDAEVGTGSVSVEVPLGNVIRPEIAALTVFNGARQDGRTTLLFHAVGRLPIATQLVFPGVIVPGAAGQTIEASIPLIPTLPEQPDAAIVAMSSTLGTRELRYYRGRARIWPKGATLPARCPAGGFPFTADFAFNDHSAASAAATVACPRR